MCLIIVGQAAKVRNTLLDTPRMLEDIFRSNPDGIGIMYANARRGLRIFKRLPKNVGEARKFIERMPGDERNLAVHFRWTTHGHTNKENCHPYTVVEGEVALMHNGVLHTGNNSDRSKSDTWHFIKDYLEGAVKLAPTVVHDAGFRALVKDFIRSSNRFVFMSKDGTCSIINAKEGIEHEGLWFSNTYAWSPGVLISGYRGSSGYYQGGTFRGGYGAYGYGGDEYGYDSTYSSGGTQSGGAKSHGSGGTGTGGSVTHNAGVTAGTRFAHRTYSKEDEAEEAAWREAVANTQRRTAAPAPTPAPAASRAGAGQDAPEEGQKGSASTHAAGYSGPPLTEAMTEALLNADTDAFTHWLEKFPTTTIHLLFKHWKAAPTKWCTQRELDGYTSFLYEACINGDRKLLISECEDQHGSYASVAECICYYLDWLAIDRDDEGTGGRQEHVVNGAVVASTAVDPAAALLARAQELYEEQMQHNPIRPWSELDANIKETWIDAAVRERVNQRKQWPFPTTRPEESSLETNDAGGTELPHEVQGAISEAQMSQGGDSARDDGYAYIVV